MNPLKRLARTPPPTWATRCHSTATPPPPTGPRSPPDVTRIVFAQRADHEQLRLAAVVGTTQTSANSHTATSKNALLDAALVHVPRLGFTQSALVAGCEDLGLSHMAAGICQRGPVELVDHFVTSTTTTVSHQMRDMDLASMRVPVKIRSGVLLRLDRLKPVVAHWPDALALMAMPQNVPTSLHNLGALVDEIWYVAGDKATDLNWYSKRALLAGVYTSTELFMTQDKSPNFVDTEKFLDRRLADTAFIGRTTNEVRNMVGFGVRSVFGVLASKGFRL
ncbi:COQ9-domain-containing protein [Chytriomyces sp. MP71]|nr:COQ9-domain-containing protein [Chytriomyces sp. MP71]